MQISRELANAMMNSMRPVDAFDTLAQAIDDLPVDADRELRHRAEAELLAIGMMSPLLSTRVATRVQALPELTGTDPGERLLLANVARHRSITGAPWAEVVADAEKALAGGMLLLDQIPDSVTFPMAVLLILIDGQVEEAERLIDLLSRDAGSRGSLVGGAMAAVSVARVNDVIGNVRAAESAARRALELAIETGRLTSLPLAVHILIRALIERGQLEEGEQILQRFGMSGPLPDSLMFFNHVLVARGRLRIAQQRHREGLDDLMEIGRRDRLSGCHEVLHLWRSLAAPALVALGKRDRAIALVGEELEEERTRGTTLTGAVLRAFGNLLGGPAGIDRLRESVTVLEHSPFRLERAHALADLGAAVRRTNRRAEARQTLRQALDLAHRCGADALEATLRTELLATGARPRKVALTGLESLTASERRVAELAARGHSNPEIAQQLFVTRKTVEVHLGRAYSKLDIKSRTDLPDALGPPVRQQ